MPKVDDAARAAEAEASGNICRRGGTTFDAATAGELRALRLAVEPVFRDLERDPGTRAAIKAIERLKTQLGAAASRASDLPPSAEPPASSETAIDGVWRMKTDREAAGTEGYAENWGDWIYVFDRGGSRSPRRTPRHARGDTARSASPATR